VAWVVHVVRRTRDEGAEDFELIQLADFLDVARVNDVEQVLSDVRPVHFVVVKVLAISFLEVVGHVPKFLLGHLRQGVLPVQFVVDVEKREDH